MGSGPCWGHEGREAELESDISRRRRRRIAALVAGEEEAEERGDNGGRGRAALCVGGEGAALSDGEGGDLTICLVVFCSFHICNISSH